MRNDQIWAEDRQWARSHLMKNWSDGAAPHKRILGWHLETRTEDSGAGSVRMGVMVLTGSFNGDLTIRLDEVNHDAVE